MNKVRLKVHFTLDSNSAVTSNPATAKNMHVM